MEITILNEKENKILGRKELNLLIEYESSTPKKEDVKSLLSAQLNANPNLIILTSMKNIYGSRTAKLFAKVYSSPESLKQFERTPKPKKEKPAEEAEAKPEEKKPEAKPKEEKKEEKEAKPEKKEEKKAEAKPKEEKPKKEAKPEKEPKEKPKEEKK